MTKDEAALLNSAGAVVLTLPVSGGIAALTATGKVIQLSAQGQNLTRSLLAAGQARTIQAVQTTQVLATDAALTAFSTAAPIVSNPTVQQNTLEFLEGLIIPGPPPPTPAGALGYATSEALSD